MSEKQIMPVVHRDTNLELFRCITMLLIIAHHYVVNSGLLAADSPIWENPCSWRSLFILAFGAFGKTGINCFVLITGYYMCMSRITPRKFFKLLAEVYFYRIVISSFFALSRYQPFTARMLLRVAWPFMSVGTNFTSCFLLFYLAIPFLSILAQKTTTRQHMALVCLCLFIYTFLKGIPKANVPMNYVSWFTSLFFISSFMRLRMNAYMKTKNSIYEWGGACLYVNCRSLLSRGRQLCFNKTTIFDSRSISVYGREFNASAAVDGHNGVCRLQENEAAVYCDCQYLRGGHIRNISHPYLWRHDETLAVAGFPA